MTHRKNEDSNTKKVATEWILWWQCDLINTPNSSDHYGSSACDQDTYWYYWYWIPWNLAMTRSFLSAELILVNSISLGFPITKLILPFIPSVKFWNSKVRHKAIHLICSRKTTLSMLIECNALSTGWKQLCNKKQVSSIPK